MLISEFMAANTGSLLDRHGEPSDWIEIYNPTEQPVTLDGWYLTDDADDLTKWRFPLGAGTIAPHEFRVVFASNKDIRLPEEELHTNFKLTTRGEYLALVQRDGNTIAHQFGDEYPWQFEGLSFGLTDTINVSVAEGEIQAWHVPDSNDESLGTTWTTPGFDASAWQIFAAPPPVKITEICTGSDDWAEVQNLSDVPVDTSGWVVAVNNPKADEGINGLHDLWYLPPSLETGQVLYRTDDDSDVENYWHDNLLWNTSGDGWAMIVDDVGNVADFVAWGSNYDEATLATLDVNVNGFQVTGGSFWDGPAAPKNAGRSYTLQRHGSLDHDSAADWDSVSSNLLAGDQNVALNVPFDRRQVFGIGFDRGSIAGDASLGDQIQIDVGQAAHGVNTSLWTRIPFRVADPSVVASMQLQMKYNDGFVAYINGQEVARANAPQSLSWNTVATARRDTVESLAPEVFDLNRLRDVLQTGENTLAIHAFSAALDDTTLLVVPELSGSGARYFAEPTPGGANGVGFDIEGPVIRNLTENPPPPAPTEPVVVSAEVAPTYDAVDQVTLHYRVMFGDETLVPMVDDGSGNDQWANDGIYTAVIPAAAYRAGEMVRWMVTATDTLGVESRFPYFLDPKASPEYYGTVVADPSVDSELPVFERFIAPSNISAGETRNGTRVSVFYAGEFHDNVFQRIRGGTATAWPKKSYKFKFNPGYNFRFRHDQERVDEININATYTDKSYVRAILTYEAHRDAGTPAPETFAVRMHENGSFYSVANFVEQPQPAFLRRNGLDDLGAFYKATQTTNGLTGSANRGMDKKFPSDRDFSDLQDLIDGLALSGPAQERFVFDNVNIPAQINFMAVNVLVQNIDATDKNYFLYRDTYGTGEWQYIPWDLDLTFGPDALNTDQIDATDDRAPGNTSHPLLGGLQFPYHGRKSHLFDAIFRNDRTREMFLRRLRSLMDEFFAPEKGHFESRIDELVTLLGPDVLLDKTRWGGNTHFGSRDYTLLEAVDRIKNEYLVPRRTHLFVNHNVNNPGFPSNAGIPDTAIDFAAFPADQRGLSFGAIDYAPISGNQDEEYLQIVNSNPFAVDISGWHLTGGVEHTFLPGTVIPANDSLYATPDSRAFRSRTLGPGGNQALFVQSGVRGHLSSFGETVRLLDAVGTEMAAITYEGGPSTIQQNLRISEIMYHPATPTPEETAQGFTEGDFEFVELVNTGDVPLFLEGTHFTEGIVFTFPNITLDPGDHTLVVANQAAFETRYGPTTSSAVAGEFVLGVLSNGGEQIKLEDVDNGTIVDLTYSDSGNWPTEADGHGASLEWATPTPLDAEAYGKGTAWRYSVEYHGSPGVAGDFPTRDVVINEVLSSSTAPSVDAIELHNHSTTAIDIGGLWLSDSSDNLTKYRIGEGTTIPPGGYVVFDEHDFNPTLGADPDDFALDSTDGDDVWLVATDVDGSVVRLLDHVAFGAAAPGETLGRWPGSNAPMVSMAESTLGDANGYPRVGPLVISEIMYHPPASHAGETDLTDLEYVEIFNATGQPVLLRDWRIRGGIDLDFAPTTTLDANGTVVVLTFDPLKPGNESRWNTFCETYRLDPAKTDGFVGGFSGRLDNDGETIRLLRPGDPVITAPDTVIIPRFLEDEVVYDDALPWPQSVDGRGDALYRVADDLWGNDALSWTAGEPTPGITTLGTGATEIVGRHVYYDGSAFTSLSNTPDDPLLASDKTALLPGNTATFANYTSYTHGINGLAIDITGLGVEGTGTPSLDDFIFQMGNDDAPDAWRIAPTPQEIRMTAGGGQEGSDRIYLTWHEGGVKNAWLRVTILATPNTGLAQDDVFYFGNAIGETGNSPDDAMVTNADELLVRRNRHGLANLARVDSPWDFNRDRLVNVADQIIARNHRTGLGDSLHLLSAPRATDSPSEAKARTSAAQEETLWLEWPADVQLSCADATVEKKNTPNQAILDRLFAIYASE